MKDECFCLLHSSTWYFSVFSSVTCVFLLSLSLPTKGANNYCSCKTDDDISWEEKLYEDRIHYIPCNKLLVRWIISPALVSNFPMVSLICQSRWLYSPNWIVVAALLVLLFHPAAAVLEGFMLIFFVANVPADFVAAAAIALTATIKAFLQVSFYFELYIHCEFSLV